MRYLSVNETARKWDISERSVRNYCDQGRVNGAFLTGKTWNIPEDAKKPERSNKRKEQPTDSRSDQIYFWDQYHWSRKWSIILFRLSSRITWNCFIIEDWKSGTMRKGIWQIPAWQRRINIRLIWIILELFIR